MQRRRFLALTLQSTLGAQASLLAGSLPAIRAWAADNTTTLSGSDLETLALMVRGLLPHAFLSDRDYLDYARRIDARLGEDPALHRLIADGLAKMHELGGGSWLEASAEDRGRVLETLQDDAAFAELLNAAIDTLYRDPAVYRRLGYEGSAIEFGGYLHRGFDDIDWLPPAPDRG